MRNKGFFWFLTIILALACLYQLSFTWVTSGVEKKAEQVAQQKVDSVVNSFGPESDSIVLVGSDSVRINNEKAQEKLYNYFRDQYLRAQAGQEVYPFFGHTYEYCKQHELNFGLDLRGGMSVTLEVSTVDLIYNLAGKPKDPKFLVPFEKARKQYEEEGGDFFTIFVEEFESHNSDNEKVTLARFFNAANSDKFKGDASTDEIAQIVKDEQKTALNGVEKIIEKRVNQFGVAQPNIQQLEGEARLYIELPGVKDKESVRKKLQSTANLEFYEAYHNGPNDFGSPQIGPMLFNQVGPALAKSFEDEVDEEEDEVLPEIESQDSTETAELSPVDGNAEEKDSNETNDFFANVDSGDSTNDEAIDEIDLGEDADTSSVQDPTKQNALAGLLVPQYNQENGWYPGPAVGYASVADTGKISALLNSQVARDILPEDLQFMWSAKEIRDQEGNATGAMYLYAIRVSEDGPEVSGEDIYSAKQDFNQQNFEVEVVMQMTSAGTDRWAEMTTRLNKQFIAITMDKLVFSAPRVNEPMTSGVSQISGDFTVEEAEDLAGLLNAGALPAPAKIVEETIVGPSLGAENINSGLISFAIALAVVLMYMTFYYAKAGLVSNVALIANIFFLLGSLASMGAILTLPGIAGIVLTIGMAVDANVLIFERVREEVAAGKGQKLAIQDGFNKALSSILDANITTLLTAIVLATFGTGPIKGFAVTLIIGIFTSLFSAIIITRLIITQWMSSNRTVTFSTKMTEKWFTNVNIGFLGKRKLFYIVSGIIVVAGAISLTVRGLDYGVEFTGGRSYTVVFKDQAPDMAKVKDNLADVFLEDDGTKNTPEVKMVSDKFTAMITTNYMINKTGTKVDREVDSLLNIGLSEFGEYEITNSRKVSDSISADLKESALWSVVFALVIIFLYILLRFRRWQYGLGALLAMAHDVLIVLGIFSIFYGILPFSMEMDQAFIAAILTVVGYSINDTVVVFDRIREYLGIYRKKSSEEVVNIALNSTLSRTINTSVSTFLVLLMIFVFGGESIRGFTFALMIGVIVGTYSSVCVATPSMFDMSRGLTEGDKKTDK